MAQKKAVSTVRMMAARKAASMAHWMAASMAG
jgi:hypothetical protein